MIRVFTLILTLAFIAGCNNQPGKDADTTNDPSVSDAQNPKGSIDISGNYTGVLPCVNCTGIATELLLRADSTFYKKSEFQGMEKPQVIEERGTYTWNDSLSVIILDKVMGGNRYAVGENSLIHLDLDGNKITGEKAKMYILNKQKE